MNQMWPALTAITAAAVAGISSPARADAPADATADAPATTYVSAATTVGVDAAVDWLGAGIGFAAGLRVGDTLWLRGRVAVGARVGYGSGLSLHSPTRGRFDGLIGLETRRCMSHSTCITFGADAGSRSPDSHLGIGFEILPRVGLEIGAGHVRFQSAIEAEVAWISGYDTELGGALPAFGIGVSLGAAYLW